MQSLTQEDMWFIYLSLKTFPKPQIRRVCYTYDNSTERTVQDGIHACLSSIGS